MGFPLDPALYGLCKYLSNQPVHAPLFVIAASGYPGCGGSNQSIQDIHNKSSRSSPGNTAWPTSALTPSGLNLYPVS